MGTPRRYLQGSLDILERGDAGYLQQIRIREGVYSATPASELMGTVEPLFLAGPGLQMEKDVFVAGAILGERVILRRRASLIRTIIWDDVTVGEEASLDECIVANRVRIPPRARFTGKIILDEETYGGNRKGMERVGHLLVGSF